MNSKDNATKSGSPVRNNVQPPTKDAVKGHDQGPGHEQDREYGPECGWDRRRHRDWDTKIETAGSKTRPATKPRRRTS
ncbi:hypothetical protein FOPE_10933 [Fonsecaea pedrosoi]|nr:hypothetical protein FOPE_10933 [Fonsecaea pedrosoi]